MQIQVTILISFIWFKINKMENNLEQFNLDAMS